MRLVFDLRQRRVDDSPCKGCAVVFLLGKIRLRRPDVAEALGCWSLKEPDFGFLLAYPLAEPGHGPVSISIFASLERLSFRIGVIGPLR